MKWVLINTKHTLLLEYHLIENAVCRAILKYNPLHRSARVSCGNQHRLFFIESAGSLTGKYIFKNEYGMETGSINQEKKLGTDGTIMIDNTKYGYSFGHGAMPALTIYDSVSQQELMTCELADAGTTSTSTGKIIGVHNNYLLLGLCWYLFLPVSKATPVAVHAA